MKEANSEEFYDILKSKPKELIGRTKELEILIAVLISGEHVLLEGAPGTSKSTLLRYITEKLKLPLYQIEGSADLTPSKLILLDLTMPKMGGEEAFQKMRQINPNIPIIIMSGYNEKESMSKFAIENVTRFLQKPFKKEELLFLLFEILDKKHVT